MELDYKKTDKAVIIYLKGHVDIYVSPGIEKEISRLIAAEPESHFIFNMKGVDYISSSGLGIFISLLGDLKKNGKRLILCSMDSNMKKIFEIVKLTEMFDIFRTEEEALSFLEHG